MTSGDSAEIVRGTSVTSDFSRSRDHPVAGAELLAQEDRPGSLPVVLLTEWILAASLRVKPGVVGRSIALNGTSYTVILACCPRSFVWGALECPRALRARSAAVGATIGFRSSGGSRMA